MGQVQLSELIFTMSWEDPESDRKALQISPGDSLITITSGGCNTLSFLLHDPGKVYAVDINPKQSYLLDIKICAMRNLDYETYLEFLGIRPSNVRREIFESIKRDLGPDSLAFWNSNARLLKKGILGTGRYERFIRIFRLLLSFMQGRSRIRNIFEQSTIDEQREYFEKTWNTCRWRGIFKVFFNKRMLARRGLSADYFQFGDSSVTFADSFFLRTKHVMTDIPVRSNYFLAQYLLGRYLTEENMPPYLLRENYEIIKSRIDRISIITADLKEWLTGRAPGSFDCLSLSNICEVMDIAGTDRTFEQIARTAAPGARICFRNLILPRTVPAHLSDTIVRDTLLSDQLLQNDASFVYSRVDAYDVHKKHE